MTVTNNHALVTVITVFNILENQTSNKVDFAVSLVDARSFLSI